MESVEQGFVQVTVQSVRPSPVNTGKFGTHLGTYYREVSPGRCCRWGVRGRATGRFCTPAVL